MSEAAAHNPKPSDSNAKLTAVRGDRDRRARELEQLLRRCAGKSVDRLAGVSFSDLSRHVSRQLRRLRNILGAEAVHFFLARVTASGASPITLKYRSASAAEDLGVAERFDFHLLPAAVQDALSENQLAQVRDDNGSAGRVLSGLMADLGCECYLLVPLQINRRLRAILGIASHTSYEDLTHPAADLLRLNGTILANTIIRLRKEQRRSRVLKRWKRIANRACDFAFSVTEQAHICDVIPFGRAHDTPQLKGLRLSDVVVRSFQRDVMQQIHRAVESENVRTCDFQIALGHEGPRWYMARIEQSGRVADAHATLYLTDNNPDKILEEKVRELTDHLARASRLSLLGQMSTEFAHQLNQPLQAMMNYCNTLQKRVRRGTATVESTLESLENIERAVDHSASIIQRVRDFVKHRTLRSEEIDVEEIVEDAVMLVLPSARGWNVDLVPPGEYPEAIVVVDATQTTHVLVNLMVNAMEACCGAGVEGPRVELEILEQPEDHAIMVAVRDNGPGLPPDEPEKVFEKFHTSKSDGLGMGLAISRDVCETQGGSLTAANNTGQPGCTFFVRLPMLTDSGSDTAEIETLPESELPVD